MYGRFAGRARQGVLREEQGVVLALMIPLNVIMRDEFAQRTAQGAFAE
jgi:hypothetical protein